MLNKKNLIIIILILIILAGALYFLVYPKIYENIYTRGYDDGFVKGQYDIAGVVYSNSQIGNVTLFTPINFNGTNGYKYESINIREICGGQDR